VINLTWLSLGKGGRGGKEKTNRPKGNLNTSTYNDFQREKEREVIFNKWKKAL
jgi:hypothetical protein